MNQELLFGIVASVLILVVSSLIFAFPRRYLIRTYLKLRKLFRKKPKVQEQQSDISDSNKSPEEAQLDRMFNAACKIVGDTSSLSDMQQLTFYGLYKQANAGDCTNPRPKASDIIELKKWESWTEQKGKTSEEAKKEYIKCVETFIPGSKISADEVHEDLNKKGNDNDDDDDNDEDDGLLMTDKEYIKMKGKKKKTSFGMKFSRPTDEMNDEPVQANENDVNEFFKLIDKEDVKRIENSIKRGYDLYKQDGVGRMAIHYAIEKEKESVVALLCEHYTDLNVPDEDGMTPLHCAVTLEDEAIIELLLQKNVDINKPDLEGKSAMDLASKKIKQLIESHLQNRK